MFDIGFAELLIIAVVALLVLGPERLPVAARSAAVVLGRLKRQASDIRREIERELDVDGIRRELRDESIAADLENERETLQQTLDKTHKDLQAVVSDVKNSIETDGSDKPEQ